MDSNLFRQTLKNQTFTNEQFVRESLRLLEALHREMALLSLGQWQTLDVFLPELYQTFASLVAPTWGTWNRVLQELEKARKKVLYQADKEMREKFENLEVFNAVMEKCSEKVAQTDLDVFKPLAEFSGQSTRKLIVSRVLEWGIRLRNRIAHDIPTDPGWWEEAANWLRPVLIWIAKRDWVFRTQTDHYISPWFVKENGQLYHFCGLEGKKAPRYLPENEGMPLIKSDLLPKFTQTLATLLGEKEKQEKGIKKLLEELTPEEVKGVIMGDFLVGAPIGEGAFAKVHKAIHLATGAKMAVKILKDASDEEIKDRFRQEAELLAHMNHSHILIVFDYGESTWYVPRNISLRNETWFKDFKNTNVKFYIAMEWIDGLTLDQLYYLKKLDYSVDLFDALKNAQPLGILLDCWKETNSKGVVETTENKWEVALRKEITQLPKVDEKEIWEQLTIWFREAALALQYIHDQGLVHRDIKPGNLMITRDGRLKVMDFGIARNLAEGKTMMTMTGTALGTPAYMSPEQIMAVSASLEVGPPSDIYSLCATFYELYTDTRCYDHDSIDHLTVQTQKLEGLKPQHPNERNTSLPWELNTLLLGGIEPEPSDRIKSAGDLASDLGLYQRDEAITYRQPSVWRRLILGYRRNATIAEMIMIFLILIIVGTVVAFDNINDQRKVALKQRELTLAQMKNVEYKEHALRNQQVEIQTQKLVAQSQKKELEEIIMSLDGNDDLKYTVLSNLQKNTLNDQNKSILYSLYALKYSKKGNHYLRLKNSENIFNTTDYPIVGSYLLESSIFPQSDFRLRFSDDGNYVFYGGVTNKKIWDVNSGKPILDSKQKNELTNTIKWSDSWKMFITKHDDFSFSLMVKKKGRLVPLQTYRGHNHEVLSYAKTVGSRILATGSAYGEILIWELKTGKLIKKLLNHKEPVVSLDFSKDGKTLVSSGSHEKKIIFWDVQSALPIKTISDKLGWVLDAKYINNEKFLATYNKKGIASIWDIEKEMVIYSTKDRYLYVVDIDVVNSKLVFATLYGEVGIYDVFEQKEYSSYKFLKSEKIIVSNNGKLVAYILENNNTIIRDIDTGQIVRHIPSDNQTSEIGTFSFDDRYFVTTYFVFHDLNAKDNNWHNIKTKDWFTSIDNHVKAASCLEFGKTKDILISAGEDQVIIVWENITKNLDNEDKEFYRLEGHQNPITRIAISSDDRFLASADKNGNIKIWDLGTRENIITIKERNQLIQDLKFGKDDRLFVASSSYLKVWNYKTGSEIHTFPVTPTAMDISEDKNRLVTSDCNGTLQLWDLTYYNQLSILTGHKGCVKSLAFLKDRPLLVSMGDNTMKIWNLEKPHWKTLKNGDDTVIDAKVTEKDGTVVAIDQSGAIVQWNMVTQRVFSQSKHQGKDRPTKISPQAKTYLSVNNFENDESEDETNVTINDLKSGLSLFTLKLKPNEKVGYATDELIYITSTNEYLEFNETGGKSSGKITLYNIKQKKQIYSHHYSGVLDAGFQSTGGHKILALPNSSKAISLFDLENKKIRSEINRSMVTLKGLFVSPKEEYLAINYARIESYNKSVTHPAYYLSLWNLKEDREILDHKMGENARILGFSNNNKALFYQISTKEKKVVVVNINTLKVQNSIYRPPGKNPSIKFLMNGQIILTAVNKSEINYHNIEFAAKDLDDMIRQIKQKEKQYGYRSDNYTLVATPSKALSLYFDLKGIFENQ
jgi:WD40 repeat protein